MHRCSVDLSWCTQRVRVLNEFVYSTKLIVIRGGPDPWACAYIGASGRRTTSISTTMPAGNAC